MKIVKKRQESKMRVLVNVDAKQFVFVLARGKTEALFPVRM